MTLRSIFESLQAAIRDAQVALYVVPMADEFQSEYVPECAARLKFLTGFSGSAGLGVFRAEHSAEHRHALFVDGRYTLQAAHEVDAQWVEVVASAEISPAEWLAKQPAGTRIGFDPWLITEAQLANWKKAAPQLVWQAISHNLVDGIWRERPALPRGDVALYPMEYAGKTYAQKRELLLATLVKHTADAVLMTVADSINWLLNIRGADVPFNPLLLAHLLLRADGSAVLFTHPHAFSPEVAEYLAGECVTLAPLSQIMQGDISAETLGKRLLIDPALTAFGWFALAQEKGVTCIEAEDPAQLPKALKNPVELAGIRAAHARDGLALSRFLHWFEAQTINSHFPDELHVAKKLEEFRAGDPLYQGPSFATIAGSGANGAIVHYRAEEKTNRKPRIGELFLLDSGGQYLGGTTDVTRTFFISGTTGATPAPRIKEQFTRVLRGHIALACAKFPHGTTGMQLDVLARQYLWEVGLDFDHGTGHGVGAYLCVHEGPQRISKRGGNVALQPGMILSNEPGYYEAGHHGIRIENLVVVVEVPAAEGAKPMLAFDTLTLAPIDTRLVEVSMLSASERNWLNAYHQRVYKAHAEAMDDKARAWLMRATRAV